jgi:hypothetical protein
LADTEGTAETAEMAETVGTADTAGMEAMARRTLP